MFTFEVGSHVRFDYPSANYRGARERLEARRMRIERVRDLATEPLDQLTLTLDPLLNRGRVLITGVDLDKGKERSFYVDAMRNLSSIDLAGRRERKSANSYCVVLLDPEDMKDSPEVVFESDDRDDAAMWIEYWESGPWIGLVAVLWPPPAPLPLIPS